MENETIHCDLEGCTMEGPHGHGTDQRYAIPGISERHAGEPEEEYELRLAVEQYKDTEKKNIAMMQRAIIKAREHGLSYIVIGRIFGVSRQAAWERWSKVLPDDNAEGTYDEEGK